MTTIGAIISNLQSSSNELKFYDTVYNNFETYELWDEIFTTTDSRNAVLNGSVDWSVFCIAIATLLLHGLILVYIASLIDALMKLFSIMKELQTLYYIITYNIDQCYNLIM